MKDTTSIGILAEAKTLAALVARGGRVLLPFGGSARYDLVVEEAAGLFYRIQVKTGTVANNCVAFNTCTLMRTGVRVSYTDQVDYFSVYAPKLDKLYMVPVSSTGVAKGYLRLAPTLNGQRKRVLHAADYEVEKWRPTMKKNDDEKPINIRDVRKDDAAIEKLRAGGAGDDEIEKLLAAWRDQVQE